jgi:translocation and assembly module TamB
MTSYRNIVLKWTRRAALLLAFLVALLAGLFIFLHTSAGKNLLRAKVEGFLRGKWKTEVLIGKIDYTLPDWLRLEKVLILDRQKDTLLYAGDLYVRIKLLKLLSNTVDVTTIDLKNASFNLRREPNDSALNLQFIFDSFTSAPETTSDMSGSKPMHFSVKQLSFHHVRFILADKKAHVFLSVKVNQLSCLPNFLYPEKANYNINTLGISNCQVMLVDSSRRTDVPAKDETYKSNPAPLLLSLNQLRLRNVFVSYQKPLDSISYTFQVDHLLLLQPSLDLGHQMARAEVVDISNSGVRLLEAKGAKRHIQNETDVLPKPASNEGWKIRIDTIALINNSFSYHNSSLPRRKGVDGSHIDVQDINLQLTKSHYDSSGLSTSLDEGSFLLNKQINVKYLHTGFRFTDSLLQLNDAALTINRSELRSRGAISLPLAPGTYPFPPSQFLIETLSVNYGDVLLAAPALTKHLPFSFLPSDQIRFTGRLSVNGQQITANDVRLSMSRNLFAMNGRLALQRNPSGPVLRADFHSFQLKRELLSKELLQQLKKSRLNLPEAISLTGILQTGNDKLIADLDVKSRFGQVAISGTAKSISQRKRLTYEFQLKPNKFETGKWIGLDSMFGKITGEITIKGSGIDPKTMIATAALKLSSAEIYRYPFSQVQLKAGLDRSKFILGLQTRDPNLETTVNLHGHLIPGYFAEGTIHVTHADLKQLRLTTDSVLYSGYLHLHAAYNPPYTIDAEVETDSNSITISGRNFQTNPFSFSCRADGDSTVILAKAPFFNAQVECNYPINQLGTEISFLRKTFYPQNSTSSDQPTVPGDPRRVFVVLTMTEDSLLRALVPDLSLLQPITVTGKFDRGQKDSLLSLQVLAPGFRFKQVECHDLRIDARTVDSTLQFALSGREILTGTKRFTNAHVTGFAAQNKVLVKAAVDDATGKDYFAGGIQVNKEYEETVLNILDTHILNHNKWSVSADNAIRIQKEGYIVKNLLLKNREQSIFVSSQDQQTLSPLTIRVEKFDMGKLFSILSPGDSLGMKGLLNADIVMQQPIEKIPVVIGTIDAKDITYHDIGIGDFMFQSKTLGDSLLLHGALSGTNQLDIHGGINLREKAFAIQTQLQRLDMKMLHGFARDFLSQLSGKVTGNIQIAGTVSEPSVNGEINLDSVLFAIEALNTVYQINKQKLILDNSDLQFAKFSFTDHAGHPFIISGKIADLLGSEQKLDLSLDTKDFVALNAPRRAGNLVDGTGILDAQVSLKGSGRSPVVEGSAYLQGKSNLHVVLAPQTTASRNQKEGIIFVDIDTLNLLRGRPTQVMADTILVVNPMAGFKYNLNLKVDKDAALTIILDPSSKDELVLKGEAQLNAGLRKDGTNGLTGVYRLQSGYYKMDNLLLRGKFLVTKGSTITFNGDPSSAETDITTEYEIEASPKGLLNYKDDNTSYPPRVTFSVVFLIKGSLTKPELSFDMKLKPGKSVLQSSVKSDIEHALNRLRNDVAEMNKQVFSLLLTKQFVATGEQTNLESSNLNANNALKEGISSFLSDAMNQMADQLIKGVDVDVNVKTYKTADDPVSKTDLGVSMSKDLFENRLVIRIEENIPVGNSTVSAQKSGSQYVPDITSTYKLSKDGRLQLGAYQKNEYDAVVQGYFTQYGINLIVELAYDKFKELLKRNKESGNEKE